MSLQKVERTLPSLDHAPAIWSLEGCTSANLCEDSQCLSEGFRERESQFGFLEQDWGLVFYQHKPTVDLSLGGSPAFPFLVSQKLTHATSIYQGPTMCQADL